MEGLFVFAVTTVCSRQYTIKRNDAIESTGIPLPTVVKLCYLRECDFKQWLLSWETLYSISILWNWHHIHFHLLLRSLSRDRTWSGRGCLFNDSCFAVKERTKKSILISNTLSHSKILQDFVSLHILCLWCTRDVRQRILFLCKSLLLYNYSFFHHY